MGGMTKPKKVTCAGCEKVMAHDEEGYSTKRDFAICGECYDSGAYEECRFCGWQSTYEHCRHIFWSSDAGEWMGAGATNSDPDSIKESFFVFLGWTGLAREILGAMRAHAYRFRYFGSMLGPVTLEIMLGTGWEALCDGEFYMKRPDGAPILGYAKWLHAGLEEPLDEKDPNDDAIRAEVIEQIQDAVGWLVSLYSYPSDPSFGTPDADDITAEWCEEFIASNPEAVDRVAPWWPPTTRKQNK